MVSNVFNQRLRLKFAKLDRYTPDQFVKSQWERCEGVRLWYVCYRWCMVWVAGALLIISALDATSPIKLKTKWPIYLTNWGLLLCFSQLLLASIIVTTSYRVRSHPAGQLRREPKMSKTYWIYWILHTTSLIVAFGISTVYWSTIYDPEINRVDISNISVHALNSVIMFVDLMVVAHPVKFLHFIYPIGFTVIYISFNYVYYAIGGTDREGRSYVYKMLDWKYPGKCGLAIFWGLIFLFCLHVLVWFAALLRTGFSFLLNRRYKHECYSINGNDLDIIEDVVRQTYSSTFDVI